MTDIRVEIQIPASPEAVWADVRDIGSHVEWMHDAEAITFTSPIEAGVGTTFDCATRIGPIRLTHQGAFRQFKDQCRRFKLITIQAILNIAG